jgi:N-acetylglutamate synthase-like GNAT family acetyltransferase
MLRQASVHDSAAGGRLTSYYEFQARLVKRSEVALDVVEFEVVEEPESSGIEVEEKQFESWDELFAHVKQVMEELE